MTERSRSTFSCKLVSMCEKDVYDDLFKAAFVSMKEETIEIGDQKTPEMLQVASTFQLGDRSFSKTQKMDQTDLSLICYYESQDLEHVKLAVKYYKWKVLANSDKKLVEVLEKNQGCHLIRFKFVEFAGSFIMIMEQATVLSDVMKTLSVDNIACIMASLYAQLQCLANIASEEPLYYTDIKPGNVFLSRCGSTKQCRVFFGDLGSMSPDKEGHYTSTLELGKDQTGTRLTQFITEDQVPACLPYILAMMEKRLSIAVAGLEESEERLAVTCLRYCLSKTNRFSVQTIFGEGRNFAFILENWDSEMKNMAAIALREGFQTNWNEWLPVLDMTTEVVKLSKKYQFSKKLKEPWRT